MQDENEGLNVKKSKPALEERPLAEGTKETEQLEQNHLANLTRDASQLLDYAISVGASIPDALIEGIRSGEAAAAAGSMSQKQRIAFEMQYRDLAALMRPVTVQSLNNTAETVAKGFLGSSPAERWSRFLWIWTWLTIISIVAIELVTEVRTGFVPLDAVTDADLFDAADRGASAWIHGAQFILPFLYGALGACAYLLRACHKATYRRTFDALRRAEYLNRILLGIIAGGAVGLFGGELFTAESIQGFGEATLGFLAGYNCDFLFTAIERVIAAFLPKVEAQRVEARSSREETPVALRDQE